MRINGARQIAAGSVTADRLAAGTFTKGDLLVVLADGSFVRLPVGADGAVLTADATAASGLKWAAPSGGGTASNVYDTAVYDTAAYG